MKTNIINKFALVLFGAASLLMGGCSEEQRDQLDLDREVKVLALTMDGEYTGTVGLNTVEVAIPADYDASEMTLSALELSEGAESDIPTGTVLNMNYPQTMTVTNGNVYYQYTLSVKRDNAEILSFMLDGQYNGSIEGNVINVFVPLGTDMSSMTMTFTLSEGAVADVESGSRADFTQPVTITVTYKTATTVYTVNVIENELSTEPKAFIGIKATVDELGNEAQAAARWALANIPNITYVSLEQVKDGSVKLDSYKMIWCHFDWTDWPSLLWDTRDQINAYYLKGGNILATRDGARYINDVWRIALDQQSPNNMFGGESTSTLTEASGFSVYEGAESHELYKDIETENGVILLKEAGCATTERTLQWGIDWSPYGGLDGWKSQTGALPLASTQAYDGNRVTIAEFTPREAAGNTSGTVITIGTPYFEWYDQNGAANSYDANMKQLAKNAINYLCK